MSPCSRWLCRSVPGAAVLFVFAGCQDPSGPIASAGPAASFGISADACVVSSAEDDGENTLRFHLRDEACGVIRFSETLPGGSITLSSGQIEITRDVTILGLRMGSPTVLYRSDEDRIFHIASLATLRLSNVNLAYRQNGEFDREGGCIYNEGRVELTSVELWCGTDVRGGAIYNAGAAEIETSTIRGFAYGGGGAIWNAGSLTITNSVIRGVAPWADGGGAILNEGLLEVAGSTVSGWSEDGWGGGIANLPEGRTRIYDSSIVDSRGGWGGGVANEGEMSIERSRIFNNDAWGHAGGVLNWGTLRIAGTEISQNVARGGSGGGVQNRGNLILIDSRIVSNVSEEGDGGGIANSGAATALLRNTEVSGNRVIEFEWGRRGSGVATEGSLELQGTTCVNRNIGLDDAVIDDPSSEMNIFLGETGNLTGVNCPPPVDTYTFSGFGAPVVNTPGENVVNAGRSVPLKWRITDAAGRPVTNITSVTVRVSHLDCSAGSTADLPQERAAGNSGFRHLGNGHYQFNWQTPKEYARSCKTLHLDLGEIGTYTAVFRFR